jgi:hypothetical protein
MVLAIGKDVGRKISASGYHGQKQQQKTQEITLQKITKAKKGLRVWLQWQNCLSSNPSTANKERKMMPTISTPIQHSTGIPSQSN